MPKRKKKKKKKKKKMKKKSKKQCQFSLYVTNGITKYILPGLRSILWFKIVFRFLTVLTQSLLYYDVRWHIALEYRYFKMSCGFSAV